MNGETKTRPWRPFFFSEEFGMYCGGSGEYFLERELTYLDLELREEK